MTLLLMKVRRSIQRVSRGLERIQEQSPREYRCPAEERFSSSGERTLDG
jgi:hypothetical protein